jgi:hypothetical protein
MIDYVHHKTFYPLGTMETILEKNIEELKPLLKDDRIVKWDRLAVLEALDKNIRMQIYVKKKIAKIKECFSLN